MHVLQRLGILSKDVCERRAHKRLLNILNQVLSLHLKLLRRGFGGVVGPLLGLPCQNMLASTRRSA